MVIKSIISLYNLSGFGVVKPNFASNIVEGIRLDCRNVQDSDQKVCIIFKIVNFYTFLKKWQNSELHWSYTHVEGLYSEITLVIQFSILSDFLWVT